MKKIKNILKNLPHSPGIYQFFNDSGEIIYVGKSINLKSRVNSYFNGKSKLNFAKKLMVEQIVDIQTIVTNNETESLLLENTLIKDKKPKFNVLLKDDKNYLYIKVTKEQFPKIITTRIKRKTGIYYGPYTQSHYVSNILRLAKKIFWYGCYGIHFFRQGKWYNLDKYIFQNQTQGGEKLNEEEIESFYREKVSEIQSFLKWDIQEVIQKLQQQMTSYAEELKFEEAAKIKYDIESLAMMQEQQIVRDFVSGDFDVVHILEKYWKQYIGCIELRDSKIIGFYHYQVESHLEETSQELLQNFVEQRFAESYKKKKTSFIIPSSLPNISSEIQIEVPQRWGKLDILKLCYKNLYEYAHKKHLASLSTKWFTKKTMQELLKTLGYKEVNKSIVFECNDISHLSGTHTVASRSIIENGKKNPSKYRKFNIKTLDEWKIDDFWSMKEVMERRLKELLKLGNTPDLIIIDGGKWQLSAVSKVIGEFKRGLEDEEQLKLIDSLQIVSLAKREEELFVSRKTSPQSSPSKGEEEAAVISLLNKEGLGEVWVEKEDWQWSFKKILLPKDSDHLRLIQSIRDEAHRFAITFNRDARIKSMKKNILESIPWIGPVTRKKILKHYGSVDSLSEHKKEGIENILGKKVTEILENHGLI